MADLTYEPVQSSNLESVAWVENTLYVRFLSGSEYAYSDCPKTVYFGLLAARSKGEWLNQYVKGQYAYKRIR